mgnify:CR=1 FL=1
MFLGTDATQTDLSEHGVVNKLVLWYSDPTVGTSLTGLAWPKSKVTYYREGTADALATEEEILNLMLEPAKVTLSPDKFTLTYSVT